MDREPTVVSFKISMVLWLLGLFICTKLESSRLEIATNGFRDLASAELRKLTGNDYTSTILHIKHYKETVRSTKK